MHMEPEEEKQEIFQAPSQFESTRSAGNSSGAKKYLLILVSIIVIGLLIFGVGRFLTRGENAPAEATPTPTEQVFPTEALTPTENPTGTPKPTATKTPTPKPTVNPIDKATGLDRSQLSVQVLNGSGVSGAAKKAGDFLESLGYNVVQVGNADSSDFAQTTIQIKSSEDKFLSLLKKDLSSNYTVGTTSAGLAESNSADAIVTIGKE